MTVTEWQIDLADIQPSIDKFLDDMCQVPVSSIQQLIDRVVLSKNEIDKIADWAKQQTTIRSRFVDNKDFLSLVQNIKELPFPEERLVEATFWLAEKIGTSPNRTFFISSIIALMPVVQEMLNEYVAAQSN